MKKTKEAPAMEETRNCYLCTVLTGEYSWGFYCLHVYTGTVNLQTGGMEWSLEGSQKIHSLYHEDVVVMKLISSLLRRFLILFIITAAILILFIMME